jgi:hypothetical protein
MTNIRVNHAFADDMEVGDDIFHDALENQHMADVASDALAAELRYKNRQLRHRLRRSRPAVLLATAALLPAHVQNAVTALNAQLKGQRRQEHDEDEDDDEDDDDEDEGDDVTGDDVTVADADEERGGMASRRRNGQAGGHSAQGKLSFGLVKCASSLYFFLIHALYHCKSCLQTMTTADLTSRNKPTTIALPPLLR